MTDKPIDTPEANVVELFAGIASNVREGQPGTANSGKAIGAKEVAIKLAHLAEGKVSVSQLIVLMQKHGPADVELAVRFSLARSSEKKITNFGAYLDAVLLRSIYKENSSPRTQNRPRNGNYSLEESPHRRQATQSHSSDDESQENKIDRLRRLNAWTLPDNKQFWLKLESNYRKQVLKDVIHKWHCLEEIADMHNINLLSDDFVDNLWFKQVSDIINDIRLDIEARRIRRDPVPP